MFDVHFNQIATHPPDKPKPCIYTIFKTGYFTVTVTSNRDQLKVDTIKQEQIFAVKTFAILIFLQFFNGDVLDFVLNFLFNDEPKKCSTELVRHMWCNIGRFFPCTEQ